jgi:hypothetical protein
MSSLRVSRFVTAAATCVALGGCGGGAALMHPAHALAPNHTTLGGGVSSQFVLGNAADQIDSARATMNDASVLPNEEARYVEGALAQVLLGPGLAPWVGARAGLGYTSDAGLTYSGRALRLDGRHAFEMDDVALSAGLGASYVMKRPGHDAPSSAPGGSSEAVPGLDAGDVGGLGIDVPLIAGWRSQAELLQIWGGVRGGYERLRGNVLLSIDPALQPGDVEEDPLEAERYYAVGVIGLAVTIHPVVIALEVDGGYQHGEGTLRRPTGGPTLRSVGGTVDGLTLTPTAAVIGRLWD